MIKSYGKEAYYKVEELKNDMLLEEDNKQVWQEQGCRMQVAPTVKQTYNVLTTSKRSQIELILDILDFEEKITSVELIVDHVVVASANALSGKLSIHAIFTYLPTSTMQLRFYGDFVSENIYLHSSVKGEDVVVIPSHCKRYFAYTKESLYTLHWFEDAYYMTTTAMDAMPKTLSYGTTNMSIDKCDDFVVSNFNGDITACVLYIENGNIHLFDLITNKSIMIENKQITHACLSISLSSIDPIQMLYHGKDGWAVQGISKEFTLSQYFTCASLNTSLQHVQFSKLKGISSTQYTIGTNGYMGITTKGKVIYFQPISPMLKVDMLKAIILNIGKPTYLWAVELDDGIHLVVKEENILKEYLLLALQEEVKLKTIAFFANGQDLVFSKEDKFVVYQDQLYKVDVDAQ